MEKILEVVLQDIQQQIQDLEAERSSTLAQLARAKQNAPNIGSLAHKISLITARLEALQKAEIDAVEKDAENEVKQKSTQASLDSALVRFNDQQNLLAALRESASIYAAEIDAHFQQFLSTHDEIAALHTEINTLSRQLGLKREETVEKPYDRLSDDLFYIIGTTAMALNVVSQLENELEVLPENDPQIIDHLLSDLDEKIKDKVRPVLDRYTLAVRRNATIRKYFHQYAKLINAMYIGNKRHFRGANALGQHGANAIQFDSESIYLNMLNEVAARQTADKASLELHKVRNTLPDGSTWPVGIFGRKTLAKSEILTANPQRSAELLAKLQTKVAAINERYNG